MKPSTSIGLTATTAGLERFLGTLANCSPGCTRPAAGTVEQQSISLRQPMLPTQQQQPTVFHSPPGSPAVSDVFGSPQQPVVGQGQHQAPPEQRVQQEAAASGGGSASFQFQPLLGPEQEQGQAQWGRQHEDDGASSSGETDDTVSEAAVVARTMRRAGAQDRDEVQVRRGGALLGGAVKWERQGCVFVRQSKQRMPCLGKAARETGCECANNGRLLLLLLLVARRCTAGCSS